MAHNLKKVTICIQALGDSEIGVAVASSSVEEYQATFLVAKILGVTGHDTHIWTPFHSHSNTQNAKEVFSRL